MLRQYVKKTEHVVVEETVVKAERICDECGKVISYSDSYFEVDEYHNDWGNDSYESHEQHDYCSPECLTKAFNRYLESVTPFCTKAFEISHEIIPVSHYDETTIQDDPTDNVEVVRV